MAGDWRLHRRRSLALEDVLQLSSRDETAHAGQALAGAGGARQPRFVKISDADDAAAADASHCHCAFAARPPGHADVACYPLRPPFEERTEIQWSTR
jgi:hypothetical protein